jgi:hypothetical protein
MTGEPQHLHVVLGAASGTGPVIIRELVTGGLPTSAVVRSAAPVVPEGVEVTVTDIGTADGARQACTGAAVSTTVSSALPRWAELFPSPPQRAQSVRCRAPTAMAKAPAIVQSSNRPPSSIWPIAATAAAQRAASAKLSPVV